MNKEQFLHTITHPNGIGAQDLEALEEVVENFPYCQLAHILIAKASHDQASMLAPQKLRKAAAYAINRDVLKKLVLSSGQAVPQPSIAASAHTTELPSTEPVSVEVPHAVQADESTLDELPVIFDLPHSHEDKLLSELENTATPVEISEEDRQKALERQRQLELIENFIKTAPRISQPRADDSTFPDKDLSEKSSAPNNKLISESLAKIMLKQGKIEKAVEIYQELICKYPEKKAYFAGKIEELNSRT
jgi:tetratricopeptide (TPR) repeat protein